MSYLSDLLSGNKKEERDQTKNKNDSWKEEGGSSYLSMLLNGNAPKVGGREKYDFNQGVGAYNYVMDAFNRWYDQSKTGMTEVGWGDAAEASSATNEEAASWMNRAGELRRWANDNKDILGDQYQAIMDSLQQVTNAAYWMDKGYKNTTDYFSQWDTQQDYDQYVADREHQEEMVNFNIPGAMSDMYTAWKDLEDARSAYNDLYELEGPYGLLANDAVPEDERQRNQARYDEIVSKYGEGITAEALYEQVRQMEDAYSQMQSQVDEATQYQGGGQIGSSIPWDESKPKTAADYEAELAELNESIAAMDNYIQVLNARYAELENLDWNALQHGTEEEKRSYTALRDEWTTLQQQLTQAQQDYDSMMSQKWQLEKKLQYDTLGENADYQDNSNYNVAYADDQLYRYINYGKNGVNNSYLQSGEKYNEDSMFMNDNPDYIYGFMNDEEVSRYNYIYETQGKDAATMYLEYLKPSLEGRKTEFLVGEVTDLTTSNIGGTIAANALSVPLNLVGGIGYLDLAAQNAARKITGSYAPINYNSNAMLPTHLSRAVRQTTAGMITDRFGTIQLNENEHPILAPLLNGRGLADVYQLGMSAIDSRVAVLTGNAAVATTLLASSAATQGVLDALERGATDDQALTLGLWNGAFEAFFEFFEVRELLKGNPNWVKNVVNQAVIEGLGEGFTDVANNIADVLIMADESVIMRDAAEYMKNDPSLTENQAIWKAVGDAAIDAGWSMIGGGISGGFAAGGQSMIQSGIANRNAGNYVHQNEMEDPLMDLARNMVGMGGYTGKLDTYTQRASARGSTQNLGKVYNEVNRVVDRQNMDQLTQALRGQGMSQRDATHLASAITLDMNGIELTKSQERLLEQHQDDAKVQAAVAEVLGSTEYFERNSGFMKLHGKTMEKPTTAAQAAPVQEKPTEQVSVPEAKVETTHEVSEDGETHLISEPEKTVKIQGIESIEDGKMMLKMDDGSVVDSEDVSFGNEDDALVYEILADMNVSAENANAIMQEFKTGNVPASEFALDLQEAYQYGRYNQTLKESNRSASAQLVWNDAHMASIAETDTRQAQVEETYQKAAETLKQTGKAKGEHHAVLEEGITALSLTESQKASYRLADQVAQAAQVDVVVYSGTAMEQGYYKGDTVYLNLNAYNKNRQSMMAFVLGHELVHRARKGSPRKYQKFADFLVEQYGKQGSDVDAMIAEQMQAAKENGIELTRDKAFEEVVADACQRMLLDTDAGQKLAQFGAESRQNKSILDDIKRWITEFIEKLRSVFKDVEPDSLAAQEFAKFDENVKQILADMYVDMTMEAGEHLSAIKEVFGEDALIETNERGEFTMAQNEDGSEKVFNLVTWNNGGRATLEATLLREGYTQDEVDAALTIMDGKQALVESIANELTDDGKLAFPEQGRINEATLTTDIKDGHSVLSALVSNGDYPVNIDLLMVCKKRKAYQRVINRLCETGLIKQATVDALAIAQINKILGKYGFETACLGCFVESRRLRIQEWAQTIVKEWNGEVRKRDPNAKPFGFGKGEATLTPDEVMELVAELESGGPKNDKGNLNLGVGSSVKRMGVLLDKVPSLRRTLSMEDLVTPDGLTALRKMDSNLFSMVKSRYGSNSPKFVQEFNPYNHELAMYGKVPQQYESLREYLYAIGGARMQSFSDFIVENWFDYCQIVADLAARKLPMHTYTKEIAMVKLFGMTGIKINMSLIPDVDRSLGKEYAGLTVNEDGQLELIWSDKDRFKTTGGTSYMQSINFADAMSLQNDPRYSSNVGTIAIGISDRQIRMMLNDNRIRMVIPYHSSGMNPIFADLMGTSFYKDYTNFQNTTIKQMYDSNGNPVDMKKLKLTKTQIGQVTSGFLFNDVMQENGDARAAAEVYKEWCADASLHTITIKGETYTAELTPKFDDFSGEDNYYKLLADFNPYDCITEEAAPQGDVKQVYPEGFEDILRNELKGQEGYRQKQEKNQAFDKAMGEIESYLQTHTKADTVYYAEQHGINLGAKDKKLDAAGKERLKQLQKNSVDKSTHSEENDNTKSSAKGDIVDNKGIRDRASEAARDSELNGGTNQEGTRNASEDKAWRNLRKEDRNRVKKIVSDFIGRSPNFEEIFAYLCASVNSTEDEISPRLYKKSLDILSGKFYEDVAKLHPAVIETKWSILGGNISSLIRDVRAVTSDVSYKLSVGEDTSPRALLANAFEGVVQNDIEKRNLEKYQSRVAELDAEEAKLRELRAEIKELSSAKGTKNDARLSELRTEANATANRITTLDKMLLRFEASAPLQEIIKRERETVRKRTQDRVKAAAETQRKEMEKRHRDTVKRIRDTRDKAEMRMKIRKVIRDLDKLFSRGDKKRNVKEEMRDLAATVLASAEVIFTDNYSENDMIRDGVTIDLSERESRLLNEAMDILTVLDNPPADPAGIEAWYEQEEKLKQRLSRIKYQLREVFERQRNKINGTTVKELLQQLANSYADLMQSEESYIRDAFDENVYEHLLTIMEGLGYAKVKDMRLDQMEALYDAYKMVLTTIRNANKLFDESIKETKQELAEKVMIEESLAAKRKPKTKAGVTVSKFMWNNLKPVYAFERIGSDTLSKLYGNIRKGQDSWAIDMREANEFRKGIQEKYDFDSWDMDEVHTFKTNSGADFNLTLEQLMSIYAYSKREQAYDHMMKGGFVFDDNTTTTVKKMGIPIEMLKEDASTYKVSLETLSQIIGALSEDQAKFVDEMQEYLSTTMGDKGNSVSMKLYGIKLFNEKNYFPLKSAGQYMPKAKEADLKKEQGQINIASSGFTKNVAPNASNPIILSGFMDVWAGHVNEMSMYHSFVLPMEDFRKVYNYSTPNDAESDSASVNAAIQNAHGKAATAYIDQLYRDLNGGALTDSREGLAKSLVGKFKKAAVMASLSVVFQQPSAIGRAFSEVDIKHFRGPAITRGTARAIFAPKRHDALWSELKKYAPVAMIKEMGYFDTGMGMSAVEYLQAKEYNGIAEKAKAFVTDSGYRDEALSRGAAVADELTWIEIWKAVKNETAERNPEMDRNSEEFLTIAGDRFAEVIDKTQVYDSVLARSANMRSKSLFMNMATSFMAEPTTTMNMVWDALTKASKGQKKAAARAIASVAMSIIINAALSSIIYAARDDDEDETYLEKYLSRFLSDIMDSFNPITYIPILKDMWSIAQGFDVERADMSLVSDLVDSLKSVVSIYSKYSADMDREARKEWNRSLAKAWADSAGVVLNLFGVPARNMAREVNGMVNMFTTLRDDIGGRKTTWRSLGDVVGAELRSSIPILGWTPGRSKADKLFDAIHAGDQAYADRLIASYGTEKKAQTAIRGVIKERYLAGEIDKKTARDYLTKYGGKDINEAYFDMKEWDYEKVNDDEYKKYQEFYTAVETGVNLKKVIKEYTDNGVDPDTLRSQITDYFKPIYVELSTADRARMKGYLINALEQCGAKRWNAENMLAEWDFEADHKKSYDDMLSAYRDGKMTADALMDILIERGMSEDEAADRIVELDISAQYGIEYSDRDIAYANGIITENDLRDIYEKKGYTEEETDILIDAHNWIKDNDRTDLPVSKVESYVKPLAGLEYSVADTGMDIDDFLEHKSYIADIESDKDEDGKSIAYSRIDKAYPYIDSLPLTSKQKTALAVACGWNLKTVEKNKLW